MRATGYILLFVFAAAPALFAAQADFSRYEIILQRKPFGDMPAGPAGPVGPTPPPVAVFRDYRMCAITDDGHGGVRVGIVNVRAKPATSYYLSVGEERDGIELVEADFEGERAKLRKNGVEEWLEMGGGKSGSPRPSPAARNAGSRTVPFSRPSSASGARQSYADRLRKRHEAERKRAMETFKTQLSGEDLQEHLKEYQMDVIRKGLPPLPIPLTKEMDDQLVSEGVLPPAEQASD